MVDIHEILAQRGSTHGEYNDHAQYTQSLKDFFRSSPNWAKMIPHQRETLDMIAHKIGRALAGDPHFEDHWRDIAGYATLTADRLSTPVTAKAYEEKR